MQLSPSEGASEVVASRSPSPSLLSPLTIDTELIVSMCQPAATTTAGATATSASSFTPDQLGAVATTIPTSAFAATPNIITTTPSSKSDESTLCVCSTSGISISSSRHTRRCSGRHTYGSALSRHMLKSNNPTTSAPNSSQPSPVKLITNSLSISSREPGRSSGHTRRQDRLIEESARSYGSSPGATSSLSRSSSSSSSSSSASFSESTDIPIRLRPSNGDSSSRNSKSAIGHRSTRLEAKRFTGSRRILELIKRECNEDEARTDLGKAVEDGLPACRIEPEVKGNKTARYPNT
ncbi:unnamed protein product [Protopolystoma xenopodis]|uniref:Uncharacterized protein n=1 Tax=Protopolystoma xenopodis TaxID=117903 RepID=A0A3S5FGL8_9PLAT|nr:unnamed protein product [Protopolystoma xenopodis]